MRTNGQTVGTKQGRVRGYRASSGCLAFLGIPYGASTSGSNRFRPPQPARNWEGVFEAKTFGPSCPQGNPTLPEDDPASTKGLDLPTGEDCLVLNVWTPAVEDGLKRPVMVWIHGGGFRVGSGSHPVTNGANLAAYGNVVIVSLNHRLNVFGHLFLGDIGGDAFAASGVAGLLDIAQALEWIKANIAAFGGDPDQVTLFGESGGGRKVCVLMGMPAAKGLFHRAIVESGAHPRCITREAASIFASRFLEWMKIKPEDLDRLQQLPADELFAKVELFIDTANDPVIANASAGRWLLSPSVDGVFLAENCPPASVLSREIPLLIGTNKDEAALTLAQQPNAGQMTVDEMRRRLSVVLGERTDAVISIHQKNRPHETPWELFVSISSEDRRLLSIDIAEQKTAIGGAPAYMYFFTWESNNGFFKSAHTMEMPFVFRNLDSTSIIGTSDSRAELVDIVSNAWLAFAKTGNPNHAGLPHWKPYNLTDRPTMILDVPPNATTDPRHEERLVWSGLQVPMPWEASSFVSVPGGASPKSK